MDPSEEKVCTLKLVTCFQLIKLATGDCMGRGALPFIRKIRTKMLHWASCWFITVKKQYFTGVVCFLKYISWLLSNKWAHIPYGLSWFGDAAPLQGNRETSLGRALLYPSVTPTYVHSSRRQSIFLLSLSWIFGSNMVVLCFIIAVCGHEM